MNSTALLRLRRSGANNNADPLVPALLAELDRRSPTYFADANGDARVRLHVAQGRERSALYRFGIATAGGERHVIVKTTSLPPQDGLRATGTINGDRPRLAGFDPSTRHTFEYRALAAAHEHFTALGDPRLGTVRPLDLLPELGAIVMEFVTQPTLRALLGPRARARTPQDDARLVEAFRNAGAWLHEFHRLRLADDMEPLREARTSIVDCLSEFTRFLAATVGHELFFENVAEATAKAIRDSMPAQVPLGVGHGDFATRNVFVAPDGRATVFDMLGKWRVPIYEDLGYVAVALRAASPQLLSHGLAYSGERLARYHDALLLGYFRDEPIPRRALAAYELLVLLDRWAAFASRSEPANRAKRTAARIGGPLAARHFVREVRRLLTAAGAA